MTKDDWSRAERALSTPYGKVKLRADGYDLTVITVQTKALRYELMIYINGKFKVEWAINDCEIRRKFLCRHEHSLLTKKDKNSRAFKRLSKTDRKKVIELNAYYSYSPYFGSFKTLKSQLVNNNQSIELADNEGQI